MTQDLIELIDEGAVLVRQGFFTLAVEKAQEKLKKFQLPDPRYYITQVLQALLASGSKRIEVRTEGLQVKISFDGPGYSKEELERISDSVFESGKDRDRDRKRELALGLLSVQGLNPREVSIVSNGFRWEKSGPRGKISAAPARVQEIAIMHKQSGSNEAQILRQACQSCQAEIIVNDSVLCSEQRGRMTSCPWPNFPFKGANFQGAFGIAYGEIATTSLSLTRYGVVFSRRHESRILPPLFVEMEHDALRKNASQSDVVEDDSYSTMLADLQKVQLEFAIQLSRQRIPSYQAQQVQEYFLEVVLQNLSGEILALPAEELGQLETQLAQAPLLVGADGRRCSPRQVWQAMQTYGAVLYNEQHKMNIRCEPGTVLCLSHADATSLRSLFPALQAVTPLETQECSLMLLNAKQERANATPAILALRLHNTLEVVILDQPPQPEVILHSRQRDSVPHQIAISPLSFAIFCEQPVTLSPEGVERALKKVVEPLYLGLVDQLGKPLSKADTTKQKTSLQRAVFHYLAYAYGGLAQALQQENWQNKNLFFTAQLAPVSMDDMRAWLEVYPHLVGSYGMPPDKEDHSLLVTPDSWRALRNVLGDDTVVLAQLANPLMLQRSQQMGLSGAARSGVKRTEKVDEDEELAAIRKEIEQAQRGGLQALEEKPLDESAVLQHLRLQPKAIDLAQAKAEVQLPPFCQLCLSATQTVGTRWLTAFRPLGPGVQGQILVHDGALPKPLQPDQLVVKVADNDPVPYPTRFLGVSGWLYLPPNWEPTQDDPGPVIRPDSSRPQPGQSWPEPSFPFDLGTPSLHQDLLWAVRNLYKLAAQNYAQAKSLPLLQALWGRRLAQFLLWDEGWALSSPESWFLRISLWRTLGGEMLNLQAIREIQGPIYWAPLGPGHAQQPEHTLRLLPPFQAADLDRLIGRPLSQTPLQVEEKKEEQLLGELKQFLVQTCQRAQTPLEVAWVEGLKFGEPTRWLGGPRKYFIEHDAAQAVTRLNPADALFLRLFRDQQGWEAHIPVLASAVYTAINRALSEVEDEHELAYLEAMLAQLD